MHDVPKRKFAFWSSEQRDLRLGLSAARAEAPCVQDAFTRSVIIQVCLGESPGGQTEWHQAGPGKARRHQDAELSGECTSFMFYPCLNKF